MIKLASTELGQTQPNMGLMFNQYEPDGLFEVGSKDFLGSV